MAPTSTSSSSSSSSSSSHHRHLSPGPRIMGFLSLDESDLSMTSTDAYALSPETIFDLLWSDRSAVQRIVHESLKDRNVALSPWRRGTNTLTYASHRRVAAAMFDAAAASHAGSAAHSPTPAALPPPPSLQAKPEHFRVVSHYHLTPALLEVERRVFWSGAPSSHVEVLMRYERVAKSPPRTQASHGLALVTLADGRRVEDRQLLLTTTEKVNAFNSIAHRELERQSELHAKLREIDASTVRQFLPSLSVVTLLRGAMLGATAVFVLLLARVWRLTWRVSALEATAYS